MTDNQFPEFLSALIYENTRAKSLLLEITEMPHLRQILNEGESTSIKEIVNLLAARNDLMRELQKLYTYD